MVFSSFIFLFCFLPIVSVFYFLSPKKFKNIVLLVGSLVFYAWGAPNMLLPLVLSCTSDYFLSRYLVSGKLKDITRRKILLISVSINVALLAYYKYMNFFVAEFDQVLSILKIGGISWAQVALPIGISFFTFQKVSYLVDVYRGTAPRARNLPDYILYVSLFPQLIAGPIVRYVDVASEIVDRKTSLDLYLAGLFRFVIGLSKKVLIADAMGTVADGVFGMDPEMLTLQWAWVGVLAYAFQIYFDFSGYSDMAIGLGWIFGFHFKENFLRPYQSLNITEFWRRWHISLSTFMREYLYYPLGGSHGSKI